MKLVTNRNKKVKTQSVKNVLKKGLSGDKVIAYRRVNDELEEYAFLRNIGGGYKGFVSLIGGANYAPCLIHDTYKDALEHACSIRNVYVFKDLQDFLNNKHKMEM